MMQELTVLFLHEEFIYFPEDLFLVLVYRDRFLLDLAFLEAGDFFVLDGITLYVAEIGEPLKTTAREVDRRLRLILANGAHPFVPPIGGVTREGVLAFRTLADVRSILED